MIGELPYGAGALLIVALCLRGGRAAWLLSHPASQFLGRISYSLYLLHVPILLFVAHHFAGALPLHLLVVPIAIVSILVASAFHAAVDAPAQAIGRWAGRRGIGADPR